MVLTLSINRKRGEGKQVWRSGESTGLPPVWPGFDSRSRRHVWAEFVSGITDTC